MNTINQYKLYEQAHRLSYVFHDLPPLIQPEVNINGTSCDELVEQVLAVRSALQEVDKAMARAMPHGRDWQVTGGDQLAGIARAAWLQRRMIIDEMTTELEILAQSIAEQRRP
jgi:ABC-type dipeptide/oligopeptide/nickel transport system ATPase subunit